MGVSVSPLSSGRAPRAGLKKFKDVPETPCLEDAVTRNSRYMSVTVEGPNTSVGDQSNFKVHVPNGE